MADRRIHRAQKALNTYRMKRAGFEEPAEVRAERRYLEWMTRHKVRVRPGIGM